MQLIRDERNDVRYLVPTEHGGVFASPRLSDAGRLIGDNQDCFRTAEASPLGMAGTSFSELRSTARNELLQMAETYAAGYLPGTRVGGRVATAPLIMTGHQPELFHPGVWIKNFAASMLADRHGGTAINVLIDNDVVGHPQISVPIVPERGQPTLTRCSIDADAAFRPYEQRKVIDHAMFATFGDRVADSIRPLVADPLITEIWPTAVTSAIRQGNLGRALAEARHVCERQCGLSNWDIPLSALCETDSFRHFVAEILFDLPRFVAAYNTAIVNFRQRHRLRSRAHPAPVLPSVDGALEAPFWVWTDAQPQRRPLVMRQDRRKMSVQHGWHGDVIGRASAGSASELAESLGELASRSVRFRPRALLTTLYLRLILGDLFIHGIGGGKYDAVTDAIVRDFFQISPPQFMVMSATFRLPFGVLPIQTDDVRQVDGLLREMHYHPEHCLEQVKVDQFEEFQRLANEKRQWLVARPRGPAKDWHRGLERINERLRTILKPSRTQLKIERDRLAEWHQAEKIILSREFSFCLFPGNSLRRELLGLVEKNQSVPLDL